MLSKIPPKPKREDYTNDVDYCFGIMKDWFLGRPGARFGERLGDKVLEEKEK